MFKLKLIIVGLSLLLLGWGSSTAQLRLGSIFTENMVLQQDKPIKVWGYAKAGEAISVGFQGKKRIAKADEMGFWSVLFPKSKYGGPFSLTVNGADEKLVIENVLVGEVWFASGQSNMEMPIAGWGCVNDYEEEIANADYPEIRMFTVEKNLQTEPQSEFNGNWLVCSPNSASEFSATAYFFARKLYEELKIPIGIIHSSWGGTEIESWMSMETYGGLPQEFWDKYQSFPKSNLSAVLEKNGKAAEKFKEAMRNDMGVIHEWYGYNADVSDWKPFVNPCEWQGTELAGTDGSVWFRYEFHIPRMDETDRSVVSLGAIDDHDETWLNGIKIGETKGYDIERRYDISESVLKEGKNVIVVRVINETGEAGFTSNPDRLYIQVGNDKYSLAGEWKYKVSVCAKNYDFIRITPYSLPSLLYNGMVNPVVCFPIRGIIWYQGESNENNGEHYKTLFPLLIEDWRLKWNDPDMPFYWVQLANYKAKDEKPSTASKWALIREAQDMALRLPNTGQAITIDIGDEKDVHPKNKQDVGLRLALIALNNSYGKDVIFSGPRFQSYEKKDGQIIIYLSNVGEKIIVKNKYGYIEGFDMAGKDGVFEWAQARLDKDRIIVSSDKVQNPVLLRYSWSDNPDVNVFNSANLPLAPFRIEIK